MFIKKLPNKTLLRYYLNTFVKWSEKHWIKILAISFCTFLALERNLSVQLQLSTTAPSISIVKADNQQAAHSDDIPKAHLTATHTTNASPEQLQYIKRFANVAQAEMEKFGIPASIKLAQGLLESQSGKSPLAKNNNNHFGIKCFSKNCRKGHCRNFEDDSHKDFFRIYPSAWESYRAHSNLLSKESRYQALFKKQDRNYREWATGLAKAGYATDPEYAQKLIRIIESLRLYEYDV